MTEAPPASADCTPHRLRWWIAAAFAGAFLLIVGARWMVVGRFGNDLPFHDQWNAEAVDVLRPHWSGGSIWPGLCIFLVTVGFGLLGDGLRQSLERR